MGRIADCTGLEINRIVGNVVMWFALAMVLLQFALVILRYVFGIASIFAGEGVLYLHAGLFMLGAGLHVAAPGACPGRYLLCPALPARAGDHRHSSAIWRLLGPALVILLYWSWPMVRRSWAILEGPDLGRRHPRLIPSEITDTGILRVAADPGCLRPDP